MPDKAAPFGRDLFGNPVEGARAQGAMGDTFLFPPFSVLNAREGAWQDRKRAWEAMGLVANDGTRDGVLGVNSAARSMAKYNGKEVNATLDASTSIFDPVLCELMYRWFCPPGGSILDPFAGECTKGIVAAALGYDYTGIELRQDQVQANIKQAAAAGVAPLWLCGDSAKLDATLGEDMMYDMVWTSPPYYDLEEYSEDKGKDGSAMARYSLFMSWYENVFKQAVAHLKYRRFLVVKVGEIRDEDGIYHGFVPDNIACFKRLGLHYYNEIILVTAVGSLPIRAGGQFRGGRKIGKTHQNVLVFWKGVPANVKPTVEGWNDGNAAALPG